jgi:hypothetical protein
MMTGAIVLGSLVMTFVIIALVLRYVRRISGRDLSSGVAAQATIVRMWDTGTTVHAHPVAGLELDVQPAAGAAYRVTTTSLIPRLAIGQLQPGATVPVRIDPQNQQRVALDLAGLGAAA